MNWRMHEVSDGQRRRVQIMLGLLRPFKASHAASLPRRCRASLTRLDLRHFKVLWINEITVDLDVLTPFLPPRPLSFKDER